MPLDPDAVLAAARAHLLSPDAVTDGWRGVAVEREDNELVVHFRWRQLPYPLQVRFGLADLAEGPWTSVPVATPQEWVFEVSGLLMEQLDTGGAAFLQRRQRREEIELLLEEPQHGAVPLGRRAAYYVSTWSADAVRFATAEGFDAAPAREAAEQDRLLHWWCAYVNNARGRPYVAQLVVTREGQTGARLQHLEVRRDLPGPIPDSVVAEMAYLAVFDAACGGASRVVSDLDHPALRHIGGLLPDDGALAWTADGPLPGPPDLEGATVPREWESDDDVGLAQSELSDDLGRLLDYGRQHPDSYGALRFVGARLEVSFTDPDTHRERVRATVEHPDRVDVVQAPRTERALQAVRAAVEAVLELHPDSWSGLGNAGDHLSLRLRPRGLEVAAALWQDHGDALEITVGSHRYPLDADAVAAERRWPGPEQTEPWPAGLVAEVRLEQPSTTAGAPVRGRLVLRATTEAVAFDSDQPLYGELLDDAGLRVNSFASVRVGTGWFWRLQPGEQSEVEFSAGTDSSRLADGPVVSPGTWRLVVPIPVYRQTPHGLVTTQLVAGPFTVTLTEPEPE